MDPFHAIALQTMMARLSVPTLADLGGKETYTSRHTDVKSMNWH